VTIRFKARPPADSPPDVYPFTLIAKGKDGTVIRKIPIEVTLTGEGSAEEASTDEGLELSTDYPSLQAAPGDQISFDVRIQNKASDERVVDLGAIAPLGWRIAFVPRYQSQQITSIKIGGNGTETIRVQVTPPMTASGDVPITFVARTGSVEEKLDLTVTVHGEPDLKLGTEAEITGTGETRNIRATEGRERTYTFYLWNEGTAPLHDLHLFASKPQDWEVTVEPERIDVLDPISQTRKPEAITVKIRPRSRAIPGDYQVTITAAAQEQHDHIDIRVSVGFDRGAGDLRPPRPERIGEDDDDPPPPRPDRTEFRDDPRPRSEPVAGGAGCQAADRIPPGERRILRRPYRPGEPPVRRPAEPDPGSRVSPVDR